MGWFQTLMASAAFGGSSNVPFPLSILGGSDYFNSTLLSGVSNSSTGAICITVRKFVNTTGAFQYIVSSSLNRFSVLLDSNNCFRVSISDGTNTFTIRDQVAITLSDGPVTYVVEWNTAAAAGSKTASMYRNGVSVTPVLTDTNASFSLPASVLSFYYGCVATSPGSSTYTGWFERLLVWLNTTGIAANNQKLYKDGELVDPGSDGSLVNGVAADVYLTGIGSESPSVYLTNRGKSGGTITQVAGGVLVNGKNAMMVSGDSLPTGTGSATNRGFPYWTARGLATPRHRVTTAQGGAGLSLIRTNLNNGYPTATAPYSSLANFNSNWPNGVYLLEGGTNNQANPASANFSAAQAIINDVLAINSAAKWIFLGGLTRVDAYWQFTITNGGSGYSAGTYTISSSNGGTVASGTYTVSGGAVSGLNPVIAGILNPGVYTVNLSGAGTGAVITASLNPAGLTNITDYNAMMLAAYPDQFKDWCSYLLSDQAWIDVNADNVSGNTYTKTAQDIADISYGIVPTSFRTEGSVVDPVHINTDIHRIVALKVCIPAFNAIGVN